MGKKTSKKFITLTAIAMCVVMVLYVASMFITISEHNYKDEMSSSEFINAVTNKNVKLKNEDYNIKKVTCTCEGREIDLTKLKGSDSEIRQELIDQMGYELISTTFDKRGNTTYNITDTSDPKFNLEWTAHNSPAKLIWFPQHPTTKDFISEIKSKYYRADDVEYDINDAVLFPVIMFVFGIAGAVLIIVFRKYTFFLIFPIFWIVMGLIAHINGFIGSLSPATYIYNIFKDFSSGIFTVQFVLIILTAILTLVSIFFRIKLHKAIKAEEQAYYAQNN